MNRLVLLAWLVPTVAEAPLAAEEPRAARDDDFGVEQSVPTWVLHRATPVEGRLLLSRRALPLVHVRTSWDSWGERVSPDDIKRVIRNHRGAIRYCYETALISDPELAARVTVQFVISESGAVSTSDVTESSGNVELDDCVAGRIALMPFPSPGAEARLVVHYPFVFAPSGL